MQVGFKTSDIIKKLDALIIQDVTAKKNYNKEVEGMYTQGITKFREDCKAYKEEANTAKNILDKYSDEELRGIFFEERVYRIKKWWKSEEYVYHERKKGSVILDGEVFSVGSGYLYYKNIRSIEYIDKPCKDGIGSHKQASISWCKEPPELPKRGLEVSEHPCEDLVSLKDKILLAIKYGVDTIFLDENDITLISKDYTKANPFINGSQMAEYLISRGIVFEGCRAY